MTMLEILEDTRVILDKPESWTKRAYARDTYGMAVNFNDLKAACYCLTGALELAKGGALLNFYTSIYKAGFPASFSIILFNDAPKTTHADVLAFLDKLIAAEISDTTDIACEVD